MREHTAVNEIQDEGQLGAVEGVLSTVDQLIIDRCIMEEFKQHHRNGKSIRLGDELTYEEREWKPT